MSGTTSVFDQPLNGDIDDVAEGLVILIDGDTAPRAITSGQYLFIKNHSTLATGGYHATAAIASGASITSSNVAADANGIVNALDGKVSALNSKFTWKKVAEGTTTANSNYDQTITLTNMPANVSEYMFTIQRNSNGRTFASTVVSASQFSGGAIYAFGTFTLLSGTFADIASLSGAKAVNAVCIQISETKVEIACNPLDEAVKLRLWAR